MRPEHRIVVGTEDAAEAGRLAEFLTREGFEVDVAQSYELLMRALEEATSLALVASSLSNRTATEVLRSLRYQARYRRLPVIVLGSEDDEVDRVVAFELGADDYVAKPPSLRELSLRVRAILRRAQSTANGTPSSRKRLGPISIDPENHEVRLGGKPITLTPLELRLLDHLLSTPGEVHRRQVLIETVWERSGDETTRVVDTAVKRLRRKLGDAGELIETVRGVGYRARAPREGATSMSLSVGAAE
jgi:two-component system phosphate regulon response regulator PhoB